MATIPAFSVFSAVSELLVTAAVFYVLWRAYYRNDLRTTLLAVTLSFEALVNIAYMTMKTLELGDGGEELSPGLSTLAAVHGILSLAMFLALVAMAIFAARAWKRGENLFRQQPAMTLGFVIFWSLSIVSGEALFVGRYLL